MCTHCTRIQKHIPTHPCPHTCAQPVHTCTQIHKGCMHSTGTLTYTQSHAHMHPQMLVHTHSHKYTRACTACTLTQSTCTHCKYSHTSPHLCLLTFPHTHTCTQMQALTCSHTHMCACMLTPTLRCTLMHQPTHLGLPINHHSYITNPSSPFQNSSSFDKIQLFHLAHKLANLHPFCLPTQ